MAYQGRIAGDSSHQKKLARMIRVNQAGEYGAKRIYQGQLKVLENEPEEEIIEHMLEQELVHLDFFNNKIAENRIRPSILSPLWHIGGYALGAATARMGAKAAMACTVAVEEVIDQHYQMQIDYLENLPLQSLDDIELLAKLKQFQQEELQHRDTGLDNDAELAPLYKPLSFAIKKISKLAIFLAERY